MSSVSVDRPTFAQDGGIRCASCLLAWFRLGFGRPRDAKPTSTLTLLHPMVTRGGKAGSMQWFCCSLRHGSSVLRGCLERVAAKTEVRMGFFCSSHTLFRLLCALFPDPLKAVASHLRRKEGHSRYIVVQAKAWTKPMDAQLPGISICWCASPARALKPVFLPQ